MADKKGHQAPRAGTAAAGQPDSVRNVVLVGHSGAGKTTLVEALLVVHRGDPAGRPGRGRDHGQRLRRGRGQAAALGQPHPGAGDARRGQGQPARHARATPTSPGTCGPGLRAADAALFTVSAADGVDGLTRMLWEECAARRHAARRGHHQAGPPAGRLRRGAAPPAGRRSASRWRRCTCRSPTGQAGVRGLIGLLVRAVLRLLGRHPHGARPGARPTPTGPRSCAAR